MLKLDVVTSGRQLVAVCSRFILTTNSSHVELLDRVRTTAIPLLSPVGSAAVQNYPAQVHTILAEFDGYISLNAGASYTILEAGPFSKYCIYPPLRAAPLFNLPLPLSDRVIINGTNGQGQYEHPNGTQYLGYQLIRPSLVLAPAQLLVPVSVDVSNLREFDDGSITVEHLMGKDFYLISTPVNSNNEQDSPVGPAWPANIAFPL